MASRVVAKFISRTDE
uniref:Uncharacterized protein n=1 Tax=Anopheles albimanus TaxID=7167 RepID=A0A182FSH8_ANOAL